MRSRRDLVAWQKAMELVTEIHRITADFPQEEICGLSGELRRSAVAVSSNLAQGLRQHASAKVEHFIGRACGPLAQVETQIEVAKSLGYITREKSAALLAQVSNVGRLLIELKSWTVSV